MLTTHYAATVSLDRLFGKLATLDKAVLQQIIPGQDVPIDVWIDARNLVRRVVMTLTIDVPNGPSMQETATADITDYGPQPRRHPAAGRPGDRREQPRRRPAQLTRSTITRRD